MRHAASSRPARRGLKNVFAVPAVLLIASLLGLVVGLAGDGWPDLAACALLFTPLLAIGHAWHRRG